MKILSPEAVKRALELASKPYKPSQIVKLKEDIEAKTRVLELRASTGPVDESEIDEIVRMKLKLDSLYAQWAEGEIQ